VEDENTHRGTPYLGWGGESNVSPHGGKGGVCPYSTGGRDASPDSMGGRGSSPEGGEREPTLKSTVAIQ